MSAAPGGRSVGIAVTFGLLGAWAVHDAEELATVPRWLRENLPALRERFPAVPEVVWREVEAVDAREFGVAVGVMAVAVTAASGAGAATGGRSALYQSALDGFGLHGLLHLAQAGVLRRYTPGSVTSALVVVPFTLWARARLRGAGVLRPTRPRDLTTGLAAAGGAVVVSHVAARRLLRGR